VLAKDFGTDSVRYLTLCRFGLGFVHGPQAIVRFA
jgi:hypothetical protein